MADILRSFVVAKDLAGRFEDLALEASAASASGERTCIEALHKLMGSGAARLCEIGYVEPDLARFYALLGLSAWESAALSLVPSAAGCMMSRSGDGRHIVSLLLPGSHEECTSSGGTLALAVVSTIALAIAERGPVPLRDLEFGDGLPTRASGII